METVFSHTPIMVSDVLGLLQPERGGIFVDGTLGGGGHAEAVLKALGDGDRLYGIDRDDDALRAAGARLSGFGDRFTAIKGNFFDMRELLLARGVQKVDGILLDLGVSSYQLDAAERGFSYKAEALLDMRMDQSAPLSAKTVVNEWPEEELRRIFWEYGEEKFSSKIARRIVEQRQIQPIETTTELAALIKNAIPAKFRNEPQHPARRCFQAIRIAVNGELDGLNDAIQSAHDLLNVGGRLAIITFHSLEDRIVKNAFRTFENPCICPKSAPVCICGRKPTAKVLTRHPIVASEREQTENSRSTSAKLRAIVRIDPETGTY
ncbi:MAG: 16S rRNA (cytosine(1402)-N(4))-methyltransferase RsmH [Clostridia bacterium]|nr:16S rRNA (cytosine(1402)-N(4))-methyltransferase RsmH [Clostridia bacterium]